MIYLSDGSVIEDGPDFRRAKEAEKYRKWIMSMKSDEEIIREYRQSKEVGK